jgi:hypothetical protein
MTISVAPRAIYLNCAFKPGFWSGDTAPATYYDPVNFTKIEITSQTQEADRLLSNIEGQIGEALSSVQKPTEAARIEMEANFMPPAMFGLLLGADITALNQLATTPGAAVVVSGLTLIEGLWTPLGGHKYLAAHGTGTEIVAKVSEPGATIAAEHYEVDLINGLIKATSATGATITYVTFFKAARTGEIYAAGKAKSEFVQLIGSGTEQTTQKRVSLSIWKASLAGSGAFDPVTGTYAVGSFAGDLLTPTGKASPWEYVYTNQSSQ